MKGLEIYSVGDGSHGRAWTRNRVLERVRLEAGRQLSKRFYQCSGLKTIVIWRKAVALGMKTSMLVYQLGFA